MTDEVLVQRAKSGDARAVDRLIERHYESVYRIVTGIVKDPELAADVTQDTFVKAVRALPGFRGDAAFRTWLIRIAINQSKGSLRKIGRRREEALEAAGEVTSREADPAVMAVRTSEVERVREHLARLPDKQRMAVTLRIDEGLSFREIGELIDSSEGAARVNYHHGVRRLREMLDQEEQESHRSASV